MAVVLTVPVRTDRIDSRCVSVEYTYRWRWGSDNGESAKVSVVVSAAVNAHHINVKPTVRHLTKPPSVPRCMPCYRSRCTTRCYSRLHVCEPTISPDFLSDVLRLALIRMWRCGRCGQDNHTYISLYGRVLDTVEEGRTVRQSESTSVADDQIVKFSRDLFCSPLWMPEQRALCPEVASSCKCGKEPSRSIEYGEFLDYLWTY